MMKNIPIGDKNKNTTAAEETMESIHQTSYWINREK